jgi:hypothetical protein
MTAPRTSGNWCLGATIRQREPLVCYRTSKKDSKMPNENQNNSNKNIVNQQNGEKLLNIETASSNGFASGFQAIATAYSDYTKKSFEDTKSFVEKLSGVRSLDKAIEVQTEFAKTAYQTFVTESQKITALYGDLAKHSYKPFAKTFPTNQ